MAQSLQNTKLRKETLKRANEIFDSVNSGGKQISTAKLFKQLLGEEAGQRQTTLLSSDGRPVLHYKKQSSGKVVFTVEPGIAKVDKKKVKQALEGILDIL